MIPPGYTPWVSRLGCMLMLTSAGVMVCLAYFVVKLIHHYL
jgi:hypothetical protein